MSAIQIRKYSKGDWKQVLQLVVATMEFHISIQNPVRFQKYTQKLLSDYLKSLTAKHRNGSGLLLVATDPENNCVGFVFGEVDKQDRELQKCAVKSGTIEEIYIAENARHKGLASRLFDQMEKWLKESGCELIRLSNVHENNIGAKTMYEKRGYIVRVQEYSKRV